MSDLVERLRDLHKQATVERSHYYVGKCALDAAARVEALEKVLRVIVKICDVRIHRLSLVDEIQQHARAALEQDK